MALDNNIYQNTTDMSEQPDKFSLFLTRVKYFTSKVNLKFLSLALVLLAVPVTVFMAMQQQEIRQRASGPETPSPVSKNTPWKGYIFKLKTSTLSSQRTTSFSQSESFKNQLKNDRESFKNQALKALNKKGFMTGYKNEETTQVSGDQNINIIGEYDSTFNGVALDVTDAQAQAIKSSPLVESVYKNYQVKKTLYQSVPLIKAPDVWQQEDSAGRTITGKGEKIAIIDTGVDYTHPSLGGTSIVERQFTKVSDIANPIYWDSMNFQLNKDKFAYSSNKDKINIYNFSTKKTKQIYLNTSKFIKNPEIFVFRIDGNNIVHYSANNTAGALFLYNTLTGVHKKIADLRYKKTKWVYIGLFTISNGYVYYAKATNDEAHGVQAFKIVKYKISNGTSTTIATNVTDGIFVKSGDNIAYQNPATDSTFCNAQSITIQNISTGEKRQISTGNTGFLEDYNYGKLIYVPPCNAPDYQKSLYLYDLATGTEKKISYTKDITGKDLSANSLSISYVSLFAVKIGNGVIFFNKNISEFSDKLIAYDYIKDKYVQITLKTSIGQGLAAEDKKVCFFKNSNLQFYCHDYDPNYSYPLPDHIFNSKIIDGFNFLTGEKDPFDDNGHGTHVAAITAGNGNLKGVAPDAEIVAYKALDENGMGYLSNILSALDKAIGTRQDVDPLNDIDVINLSLGMDCYPGYSEDCGPDDIFSQSVDNAVNAGIEVVVAAGNSGPDKSTIDSPATSRKAISVGAIEKNKTIAIFSSRGPLIWKGENINKPDIVAPGSWICSAKMFDLVLDASNKCPYVGNILMSGTSMASPHLAGVVALIKQAKPTFTPEQIKAIIKDNALNLGYDYDTQGSGMVDLQKIFNAIKASGPTPTIPLVITPTTTSTPTVTPVPPTSTP